MQTMTRETKTPEEAIFIWNQRKEKNTSFQPSWETVD